MPTCQQVMVLLHAAAAAAQQAGYGAHMYSSVRMALPDQRTCTAPGFPASNLLRLAAC